MQATQLGGAIWWVWYSSKRRQERMWVCMCSVAAWQAAGWAGQCVVYIILFWDMCESAALRSVLQHRDSAQSRCTPSNTVCDAFCRHIQVTGGVVCLHVPRPGVPGFLTVLTADWQLTGVGGGHLELPPVLWGDSARTLRRFQSAQCGTAWA